MCDIRKTDARDRYKIWMQMIQQNVKIILREDSVISFELNFYFSLI